MKIFVVRHGLTSCNKRGVINGQGVDECLEEEGVAQAETAAQIAPKHVTKIYASPMLRTKQTAEIINKVLEKEISYHPELMEVNFGAFSQKSWKEIEEQYGEGMRKKYTSQNYDFTPYQGESVTNVHTRLKKMLQDIKANHADEDVLIVTHGGIVRALYHIYHAKEIEGAENASIHEFEI
jgi:broad specificity phosphatase PhoE